jgi:lambda repressor-like predicted transcriptional regulator
MNNSPEVRTWDNMKSRCYRPTHATYKYYGGRGVRVCDRWLTGENGKSGLRCFLDDMGPRPSSDHSIDRKDSNKDYSPDNCQWATRVEQQNNRSNNVVLVFQDKPLTVAQWSRETGISSRTLRSRLARGWSVEMTLTLPLDVRVEADR